jgi:ribonucleoside-diphosphate reductase alpha chain
MLLSENAIKVLEKRYLKKDEKGKPVEKPEDMFRRVASFVAQVESEDRIKAVEEKFYEMMINLHFLPNSPTLMNAGRELGQLSACFVLPVEDSMEGIFDSIKYAALIHKSGGGTGFSFSRLRPAGASVNSTGGVASGPISFMKVFNSATEAVKQGGTRRGANMGILRVDHPDILEFISCKENNNDITNFNISVGLTDKFMDALEKNTTFDIIDPYSGKVVDKYSAKEIFDKIVNNAWRNGEPGIIFLDELNRYNPTPEVGMIESTNPCGEQPLLPYESCNLGSINLSNMVKKSGKKYIIDWKLLEETVSYGVRFLDNVIDVNKYPLPLIEEMTKANRKIGLGVMGFADMLVKMGVPYDSLEGVELGEKLMKFINEKGWETSGVLAEERGVFPNFEKSTLCKTGKKARNATVTTIAPTGTISIIAGTSSGVEPIFALSFVRNVMDNDKLIEVYPLFEEITKAKGLYSDKFMEKVAQRGTIRGLGVDGELENIFATAHDISPQWHIKMQAAFQKHVDNAVSKTVNFPHEATVEDVREVYLAAYKTGCKGVTIYRDGSRDEQVLTKGISSASPSEKKTEEKKLVQSFNQNIVPRPRPEVTNGITQKIKIGCGNLYITVNKDEYGICEVFTNLGRAGGCPSQSEATSRLVSLALRSGIDESSIIEQLKGIRCLSTVRKKGLKVLSCPDAIGRALMTAISSPGIKMDVIVEAAYSQVNDNGNGFDEEVDGCDTTLCRACGFAETCNNPEMAATVLPGVQGMCPECGGIIEHEGGCVVCRGCGFSKCG